jgi:hypothetical protein
LFVGGDLGARVVRHARLNLTRLCRETSTAGISLAMRAQVYFTQIFCDYRMFCCDHIDNIAHGNQRSPQQLKTASTLYDEL